jgi:hypothetical protein
MSAGEVATVPAVALRRAPVQVFGSGFGGPAGLDAAANAYERLLQQVVAGDIVLDIVTVPLAEVEKTWDEAESGRRVVFVP